MVSVVVPLYNKEKNITDAINSILNQSYQNFEIIVVNDGSTDNSPAFLNRIKDNRITVINQENKGVSCARNNGIKKAKFEYIGLLDADDLWDPSFLNEIFNLISEFPEASLYGSGYSFQNNGSDIFSPELGLPANFKGIFDYFVKAKDNTLFTSSSVVFKKQEFTEIGEFDTKLVRGEDIDLWIRFALYKKVAFNNKPLAIYKTSAENRAFNIPVPKEKCLIWNLDRYKYFELVNPVFKEFLDNWRLAHVHNFLVGKSTEVSEITCILRDTDLRNKSLLWTLLKYSPKFCQKIIYKIWISSKSILKGE